MSVWYYFCISEIYTSNARCRIKKLSYFSSFDYKVQYCKRELLLQQQSSGACWYFYDPLVVGLPCESCQPFHILALAGPSIFRDTIIDVNLEERTTWISCSEFEHESHGSGLTQMVGRKCLSWCVFHKTCSYFSSEQTALLRSCLNWSKHLTIIGFQHVIKNIELSHKKTVAAPSLRHF